MGRRAISITLAVVCLAVLLGATGLFAISRETSYMQECASEGFAIDGFYRDDKTSLEILAFLEEDACRWQLVNKDGSSVDGQFKRTDDPNILLLKKETAKKEPAKKPEPKKDDAQLTLDCLNLLGAAG